jgi:LemA protein
VAMKKNLTLFIIGGIVVIIVLWFISAQNGLVTKEEAVTAKWSQVENVYQRRLDLIPNLVETVKGYAQQEEDVLTTVTELRSRVGQMNVNSDIVNDPEAMQRFQNAQSELGGALSRLLVVAENYPDLKSNQNFLALQSQLEGTENRIAVERKRFIEAVQEYNTSIRRFPTSLVASIGGFDKKATFTADEGAERAPKVEF